MSLCLTFWNRPRFWPRHLRQWRRKRILNPCWMLLTRFHSFKFVRGRVCRCIASCWYDFLCLSIQIWPKTISTHKAVHLCLRLWVVDWCSEEDVGEQKQTQPTPVLRLRIYKSKYSYTATSHHSFLVLRTALHWKTVSHLLFYCAVECAFQPAWHWLAHGVNQLQLLSDRGELV